MNEDTSVTAKPSPDEYAPYYEKYVSLLTTDDILGALDKQWPETIALLAARKEADGDFRYAPGKWSGKKVLGHLVDTERIFTYRALRIARHDQNPMDACEQAD